MGTNQRARRDDRLTVLVDDPDTSVRVGISVWERYYGPYTEDQRP